METYESSVTAEQLERALNKSVFSVNGKTGDVSLGASDVKAVPLPSVAEVGQTIVVTAVDENGVPTAWESANMAAGGAASFRLVRELSLTEAADSVVIDTDNDGNSFRLKEFYIFIQAKVTAGSYINYLPNSYWVSGTYMKSKNQAATDYGYRFVAYGYADTDAFWGYEVVSKGAAGGASYLTTGAHYVHPLENYKILGEFDAGAVFYLFGRDA